MTEQKKPGTGIARITGTAETAIEAQQMLNQVKAQAHLIAPATACDALPEGVGISFSRVDVDISKDAKGRFLSNDTYDVNGQRGLSKNVLNKIAAACGVSWDPVASMRLDNGSDPHYCRFRAVGTYIAFDGKPQTITAEKEMDLRETSGTVQGLYERYREKKAEHKEKLAAYRAGNLQWEPKEPKDPTSQIREMRIHIQAHAETKAQLRATRSLGIKTSYTVEELQKPFIMARACWTGRTQDPELKVPFAMMTGQAFLGGVRSLYGNAVAQPMPSNAPRLMPPPPVGSVSDDSGEYDLEMEGESAPATDSDGGGNRKAPEEQKPAEQKPAEQQKSTARAVGPDFVLRFGKSKGKAIKDAASNDIEWMHRFLGEKLESGASERPEQDEALWLGLGNEIEKRKTGEL